MAIIPQQRLFGYQEIEELGDLERLQLVIKYMPDEELMKKLEKERGNGRNEYKIRPMWNSILAGIVYQHKTIESLRRELARNGQLRAICGFSNVVPPAYVYSRFLKKIMENQDEIDKIFNDLIKELKKLLPDFGERIAIDGKAIESFSNFHKEKKERDGRRDLDADYELPIGFEVTKASAAEAPMAHKLLKELKENQPEIINDCKILLADRGYDDGKLIKKAWDEYEIKPVIDIRNMWKDGEETRLLGSYNNIVYDYQGKVYCYCPRTGQRREMAYGGFEKDREALKYRCPAEHYGLKCKGQNECPIAKCLRIKLSEDRRIFTPIARSSYRWEREYKNRTAVERVNSRLDVSYGFEEHTIRGIKKMKMRCSLALIVMLTMAVGRIKEKQEDKIRSLVRSA